MSLLSKRYDRENTARRSDPAIAGRIEVCDLCGQKFRASISVRRNLFADPARRIRGTRGIA